MANTGDSDALSREVTIYGRDIRREGPYKHSEMTDIPMYSMGINERGVVTNHAGYPNLFGWVFNPSASGSEVASTIQTLIRLGCWYGTECEPYGDQGRVACATKVSSPSGDVTS